MLQFSCRVHDIVVSDRLCHANDIYRVYHPSDGRAYMYHYPPALASVASFLRSKWGKYFQSSPRDRDHQKVFDAYLVMMGPIL
jgi:hypothetical protein